MVSPIKRTWAPRGQTPIIRTSVTHNVRLNLIGALCVTPAQRRLKLHLHSYHKSINGDQVIRFLEYLAQVIPGSIVMVWDKHPIHRRRKVQNWLACHPRIHVYEFPTSAPELNPTEFVWTQVSDFTASTAPHDTHELRSNVFAGVARTRRSQKRLWACIDGSELPWDR